MLEQLKVSELKEMAKKLGIQGADSMKKAELVEAISKFPPASAEDLNPLQGLPKESSDESLDYARHPKFDKFKSSQGAR